MNITSGMKSGEVFYDIGANIGVSTVLAAREVAPGGKVYAFEPHAANFARLIDNITCNVELNEPHTEEISKFLRDHRYRLIETHYTRSAARRRRQTGDYTGGCNGVFRRVA